MFISTSACGGFDVSIKSDLLAERYIFILHEYIHLHNNMYEHTDILHHERVKYTKKLTVCLSVCGRAAGPIGLYHKERFKVCRLSSVIRCLLSVVPRPSSVVRRPSSVVRRLYLLSSQVCTLVHRISNFTLRSIH